MKKMQTIYKIEELKPVLRGLKLSGEKIGFVPTMGSLHEGHLSLIRRAAAENDIVVSSIFVNPAQFGPEEDYEEYPRDLKGDSALAEAEGADFLFAPEVRDMYPPGYRTFVEVRELGEGLCGGSRPGFFTGVATVVLKLLNITRPDVFYLGQKDAQQAVLLRRMVHDMNLDVRVEVLPTVREADGLAMSSRNRYLSAGERESAPVIYRALSEAKAAAEGGRRDVRAVLGDLEAVKSSAHGAEVDYIEAVSVDELVPVSEFSGPVLIACAVKFGKARLIDNILVNCEKL